MKTLLSRFGCTTAECDGSVMFSQVNALKVWAVTIQCRPVGTGERLKIWPLQGRNVAESRPRDHVRSGSETDIAPDVERSQTDACCGQTESLRRSNDSPTAVASSAAPALALPLRPIIDSPIVDNAEAAMPIFLPPAKCAARFVARDTM